MKQSVFLSQFGIICCLGASKTSGSQNSNLISGSQKGIIFRVILYLNFEL